MILRPIIRPVVGPIIRAVTEAGSNWSPMALFAAGEQGAWYDPSDLSTLFQNSAGTTPVTALGQPVGLMLDKRFGLARGPELVTNGGFDDDIAGWGSYGVWTAGSAEWVNGAISVTTSSYQGAAHPLYSLKVGGRYELRFTVVSADVNALRGRLFVSKDTPTNPGSTPLVNRDDLVPGSYVVHFVATQTAHTIGLSSYNSSGVVVWDNISVRELLGNHASQPTATARPTLQAGNKIDYDGVDDKLTTTFPDLGSNVTIARSVPGTGASILTGQTIGAGAWDDATDHHGLLIINRALTAAETARVTAWANTRAVV